MSMTTHNTVQTFLGEHTAETVVQPVMAQSVALAVANVSNVSDRSHVFRVPKVLSDPSAGWVAEGEEIPLSAAAFGEVSSVFYKVAGLVVVSRELASDTTPAAIGLIGAGLARDIAREVDRAFFGTNVTTPGPSPTVDLNRPAGLEDQAATVIEAGDAWSNLDPFAEAEANAAARGVPLGVFAAHPDDALALAQLKRTAASNEPLLAVNATDKPERRIGGMPLVVSPAITPGTIWGIPERGRVLVAIRNDTSVEVSEGRFFTSDQIAIRATMRLAFLFPDEPAIQKIVLD